MGENIEGKIEQRYKDLNDQLSDMIEQINKQIAEDLKAAKENKIVAEGFDKERAESNRKDKLQDNVLKLLGIQFINDIGLRKIYAISFVILFALEIVFIAGMVLLVGFNIISLTEWIISACVVGVFGQIAASINIITKHLFRDNIKDILDYASASYASREKGKDA